MNLFDISPVFHGV